jgi:hypothetical protein
MRTDNIGTWSKGEGLSVLIELSLKLELRSAELNDELLSQTVVY